MDPATDERITELELEVMRLSRYVEELNKVVIQSSLELEALRTKLERLESVVSGLDPESQLPPSEKPPHY